MKQRIIFSSHLDEELTVAISECEHAGIFVLTDTTTHRLCWPRVSQYRCLRDAIPVTIAAGDRHKNLDAVSAVWRALDEGRATRHSLLINLGGGMVTDLGGFAASTFKRGIDFINIPTTLLAMVDASVGGKTGINFDGLKNEVGVFNEARRVIIDTAFVETEDHRNILSGYAEMLKHGLLADDAMWARLLQFDIDRPDLCLLQQLVTESVGVKERIVAADPHEQGLRKALNLGHTFGHAVEALSLDSDSSEPLLHGWAVAFGLLAELWLSSVKAGFPTDKMRQTAAFVRSHYGVPPISCADYPALIRLMHHDKKAHAGEINVTLLEDVGKVKIDQIITEDEACQALDFMREG